MFQKQCFRVGFSFEPCGLKTLVPPDVLGDGHLEYLARSGTKAVMTPRVLVSMIPRSDSPELVVFTIPCRPKPIRTISGGSGNKSRFEFDFRRRGNFF